MGPILKQGGRAALAGAIATTVMVVGAVAVWAANPASDTTSEGEELSIVIDEPADGATVPSDVTVKGRAAVGSVEAAVNLLHVVDTSGSTASSGNDCNGDGVISTAPDGGDNFNNDNFGSWVLDCEIAGVIALNQSLSGISLDTGIVRFSGAASIVDVDPVAGGVQPMTGPGADADGDGEADLEQAARGLLAGGGTNFDSALHIMNAGFAGQPAGETNVAVFLSDGFSSLGTHDGSPLDVAADAGTVVHTFSVGSGAAGCATGSPLLTIADTTGGTCTEVNDPGDVAQVLSDLRPVGIEGVTVSANGGPPVDAALDAVGNWSAPLSLQAGYNTIAATVTAGDGTTATADITVCVEERLVADTVHGAEGLTGSLGGSVHDLNCSLIAPVEEAILGGLGLGIGPGL